MTKMMKFGNIFFLVVLSISAYLNGLNSNSPLEAFFRQTLISLCLIPLYILLYSHEKNKLD